LTVADVLYWSNTILKLLSLKTGVISKTNVSDFFKPEIELVKSNKPNTLISLSPKS
jgi:hypothetical protein